MFGKLQRKEKDWKQLKYHLWGLTTVFISNIQSHVMQVRMLSQCMSVSCDHKRLTGNTSELNVNSVCEKLENCKISMTGYSGNF